MNYIAAFQRMVDERKRKGLESNVAWDDGMYDCTPG